MSIHISIDCKPDELAAHMMALGYKKESSLSIETYWAPSEKNAAPEPEPVKEDEATLAAMDEALAEPPLEEASKPEPGPETPSNGGYAAHLPKHPSGRVVGEPGSGRKRRNHAEVAEDEAYLKERPTAPQTAAPIEPPPAIAAEERIDPQDAADEAAEAKPDPTLDDLRKAVSEYTRKYGMANSAVSIPAIIGGPIVEVKAADIPAAIERVKAALVAVVEKVDIPHATKADVAEAMMAYARKYDGTESQDDMKFTVVDIPEVFRKVFGHGVVKLGQIPASPENYGRALAAVNDAIRLNPFQRAPK